MATNSMQSTDNTQEIEQLFTLGAHLGHRKSRVHPKSYKYIHKIVNGVSIIDLTKTVKMLHNAKAKLVEYAKDGKKILLVATKKNVAPFAAELGTQYNVPYTTQKWLPGLLTNFDTIIKNVQKLEKMKTQQANGEWDQFVKHERTEMAKQLYKLERFYKGLLGLKRRPDMLLIVDTRKEKNAVIEAKQYNMPIVAIVDTNSNPEEIGHPIIMNDDAPEVVQFVLTDLIKTYADNYTEKKPEAPVEAAVEGEAEATPVAAKTPEPVKVEARKEYKPPAAPVNATAPKPAVKTEAAPEKTSPKAEAKAAVKVEPAVAETAQVAPATEEKKAAPKAAKAPAAKKPAKAAKSE